MIKYVKNETEVTKTWCGQEILAGETYELAKGEYRVWEADSVFLKAKANGEASIDYLSISLNAMAYGREVIALIGVIIDSHNPTGEQIAHFNDMFAPVLQLLSVGALMTSYEAISNASLEGCVVTESEREEILEYITGFEP